MGQLMIDNLSSWFATGRALTPVPEPPGIAGLIIPCKSLL
jgi:hypothetical protein